MIKILSKETETEEILALEMKNEEIGIITGWGYFPIPESDKDEYNNLFIGKIVHKNFNNLAYLGMGGGIKDFFDGTIGLCNWKLKCKVKIFTKGTKFEIE